MRALSFRWSMLLVCIAILAMAAGVLYTSQLERSVADENFHEAVTARAMADAMLDAEAQHSAYLLTGDPSALLAVLADGRQLRSAMARARALSSDSAEELGFLDTQARAYAAWNRLAARQRASWTVGRPRASWRAGTKARAHQVATFRRANAGYRGILEENRVIEIAAAALVPVKLILLLGGAFAAAAGFLALRARRTRGAEAQREEAQHETERAFVRSQARFAEAMQVTHDQAEAQRVLAQHLERTVDGASVVVFNRNNSADRLEAATDLEPDSPLVEPLVGARPQSCVSVRLSRTYERGPETDEVLECGLCGRLGGPSACQPLLVGGEVIGSVLAVPSKPLEAADRRRIDQSVGQAAPVLANLRNLAIAETRAATDSLTGLPNRRAVDDTLKRLVAQAGRSLASLSVVLLDLDHFKRINDTHGHERGDEVLAAVGALLQAELRVSDFAGRNGGEEFVVVLPDTDAAAAAGVAEHLRTTLQDVHLPGLEDAVTASFGVACFPADGGDAATLMRNADRALYAAKRLGRDRVEVASTTLVERPLEPRRGSAAA